MFSSHSPDPPQNCDSKVTLNYQGIYPCPICRHGQISELALMDAFACNFCRHIFTADLPSQSLRVEDSSQIFSWRWLGDRWLPVRPNTTSLGWAVWLGVLLLTTLPPGLIWLSYHTFPPLPDSAWYWFPLVWAGIAFCAHAGFVLWLVAEHYQWSFYVALKVRIQRWLGQL
jgi:hypothetical protein